jgi:hypothetical protein
VEAPAGPLAEVPPLDEHDVEPAQSGVPRHPGARGAATDHHHFGPELRHAANAIGRAMPAARRSAVSTNLDQNITGPRSGRPRFRAAAGAPSGVAALST